ncbi:MAG: type I phosphomannose isomerase catalytic subunit [Opitutaceae bacterium]
MRDFLRFHPLYQERVWGGRALETALGRILPSGAPIGESWEIVDRPEAQSVVMGGPWDGLTIRQVLERHAADVMGPDWPAERPFPMLVKWLDCRQRLSLQVHPPADVAPRLGGEPKTENWYIAQADPGSRVIVGLRPGITREKFEAALGRGTIEECVQHFAVSDGDALLVCSGEVHAIGAGNLILEIQQNSDTTYRVFDWGRLGLDGKPRALHIRESLDSIRWKSGLPEPVRAAEVSATIAKCDLFRIRREFLADGQTWSAGEGDEPRIASVVDGKVVTRTGAMVTRGANLLLPFVGRFSFTAVGPAVLLVTDRFGRT